MTKEPCLDLHPNVRQCQDWKYHGECLANAGYMLQFCQFTCDACPVDPTEPQTTTQAGELFILITLTCGDYATHAFDP